MQSKACKNGSGPAAHSSASFGTARSQHLGKHKQPGLSRSQGPCQAGRDRVNSSHQASSAVLGLGTPVALEMLKPMSEGAVITPGTCWGSACSLTMSLEESRAEVPCPEPLHQIWERAGNVLPDAGGDPGATGKGSHGAPGVQDRELLGAPGRTRRIGSTRGECSGLLEVSQGTAPALYPSYNGPWTCSEPWTQSKGHDPWVIGSRGPCSSSGVEMTWPTSASL